jgi:AP-1 complex subunit gamma-1
LTLAATWVIGEYGDALLNRGGGIQIDDEEQSPPPAEHEVVDLFETILNSSYSGQIVTQYIVTSVMKLTTRLKDSTQINRIHKLLNDNQTNLDIEIQQRAVEYGNLFSYQQIMRGVLEKMPAPEIREEQRVLGEAPKRHTPKKTKKPSQLTEQDLLGLVGGSDDLVSPNPANGSSQNNADLLMGILGNSPPTSTSTSPPPARGNNVDAIMSLFGNSSATSSPAPGPGGPSAPPAQSGSADLLAGFGGSSSSPAPASAPVGAHEAYNRNGLYISIQLQRANQAIQAVVRFKNSGSSGLRAVNLQAAVPKTQKLILQSISTADIAAGGDATQLLRVTGVNGVSFIFSFYFSF